MSSQATPPISWGAPRYHRIADHLRAQILDGDLAPGQQLPTEAELMTLFTTSRNTVRLAIRRLIDETLVTADQGRGTFVRIPPQPLPWNPALSPQQWMAAVEAAGHRPGQQINVSIVLAPQSIADRLGQSPGSALVHRRRVATVNDEPVLLVDEYAAANPIDLTVLAEAREVTDLGAVLAGLGLPEVRSRHEMAARLPSRAETDLLRLPTATAVLEHIRTGYAANGQPTQVAVTILPGDRHVLTLDVPAQLEGQ
jgi:DNA-binding GntR family transcriptional regulator